MYCTCSLDPDEGEKIIQGVLKSTKNWRQIKIKGKELGISPNWVDSFGGLRLRPDFWPAIGGMDGFYIAILSKDSEETGL